MPLNRRDFMSGAAVVGASLVGTSSLAASSRVSDIKVAIFGVRGRGRNHFDGLSKNVTAICDIDQTILDERAGQFSEKIGRPVEKYIDYRELLEKADIDAVSIATPNHTHCLLAIAAIKAGKDVYCEKPISHNVWEGRQLVAAARKHDAIVQCGTQSRSSSGLIEAKKWADSGHLGKLQYALGTCYKPRTPIGKLEEPLEIAETINYDLWCGPAAKEELYRPQLHYDWHWNSNTGNGDMGNQGIHQMDIARWFLGEDSMAPRTMSIGGRLGYDDAGDTPNTQVVYHDYEQAPLVFETRGLPRSLASQKKWGSSMDRFRGSSIGVIVQYEGGHLLIPNYSSAIAYDRSGKEIEKWGGGGDHYANWLDAIVSRDRSKLKGEIQEGHLSSSLCHVGGVSHQIGEKAVADDIAKQIDANPLFSMSFDRMASHLRANDVDIDSEGEALTIGPWVEVDPKTERFSGAEGAEQHFRRDGRDEFKITDYEA